MVMHYLGRPLGMLRCVCAGAPQRRVAQHGPGGRLKRRGLSQRGGQRRSLCPHLQLHHCRADKEEEDEKKEEEERKGGEKNESFHRGKRRKIKMRRVEKK